MDSVRELVPREIPVGVEGTVRWRIKTRSNITFPRVNGRAEFAVLIWDLELGLLEKVAERARLWEAAFGVAGMGILCAMESAFLRYWEGSNGRVDNEILDLIKRKRTWSEYAFSTMKSCSRQWIRKESDDGQRIYHFAIARGCIFDVISEKSGGHEPSVL